MKKTIPILAGAALLLVQPDLLANALPLSIVKVDEKTPPASTHKHFKDGYLTFNFATKSGKLKLRKLDNKVYWDSNRDGAIDARDTGVPSLSVLSIPVTIGKRLIPYPIRVKLSKEACIDLGSLVVLQTRYQGQVVQVFDKNLDGAFCPDKQDEIQFGSGKRIPFTEILVVEDRIYRVSKPRQANTLAISAFREPPAWVHLKASDAQWQSALTLVHRETGCSFVATTRAPVAVVPGAYTVTASETTLHRKDHSPVKIASSGQKVPLKKALVSGENKLLIGPPVRMDFQLKQDEKDWRRFTLGAFKCFGESGLSYNLPPRGKAGKNTLKSYLRSGTRELQLSRLEYG